jgi:hypothetical protein
MRQLSNRFFILRGLYLLGLIFKNLFLLEGVFEEVIEYLSVE